MKQQLRYFMPALIFAGLVAFFAVSLRQDPREISSPLIGKTAPAFDLEALADPARRVASSDYAGGAWLLNVWATWCGGCREEHETLLAIAREGRVPMIGLNWRDDRHLAQRWLDQLGDPYDATAFDPEGRTAIDWGVYGAPETFLIGADGRVLHKLVGPMNAEIWRRDFLPLLAAPGAGG